MRQEFRNDYTDDWPDIAKAIKDAANWCCVRCGHEHDPPNGYTLTVHHLDGDKANNKFWNTPALCQRCHLSIQSRVIMRRPWLLPHSEWFRSFAAGYYAYVHGLPDDRDYVMAHIDELLDLGQPTRME